MTNLEKLLQALEDAKKNLVSFLGIDINSKEWNEALQRTGQLFEKIAQIPFDSCRILLTRFGEIDFTFYFKKGTTLIFLSIILYRDRDISYNDLVYASIIENNAPYSNMITRISLGDLIRYGIEISQNN